MFRTRVTVLAAIISLAACTSDAPDASASSGSAALSSNTSRLKQAVMDAAAVQLTDGRVLIIGGVTKTSSTSFCELWDPATGYWSYTGSLHGALQ